MTNRDHIRNPAEWTVDQLVADGPASHDVLGAEEARYAPLPEVRRIDIADLRDALARGLSDFATYRSDVVFICIIYPLAGLLLAALALNYDIVPLLFLSLIPSPSPRDISGSRMPSSA